MATFCLPKQLSAVFLKSLKEGKLDPQTLKDMSSRERRKAFANVIGEESAKEVNILFEKKLLLKNQQKAMISWAEQVAGLKEPVRRDLIHKINQMERILQPAEEKAFLADLAEKKLGISVTADEAQKLFNASKLVSDKKAIMLEDMDNVENRIEYGLAFEELQETIDSYKPTHRTPWDIAADVISVPKTIMSSVDLSAWLNQGWGMISTKQAWQGFGNMFLYLASERNYKRLNAFILSHPDYKFAVDGKLGITSISDKLSVREEAIQSSLVEKANQYLTDKTGVPNLIRASNRAYNGYLNYVRFNRFSELLNAARLSGEDVSLGSHTVRDLAKVVNDFTGRGAIGYADKHANAGPLLNAVLWAPRKISATVEMFNPVNYLNPKISSTARKAALRQLTGSLVMTGAVISLARSMGYSVDLDPRSTDFAKIDIDGVKFDITGGNAIYLRLLARLITNQTVNQSGEVKDLGVGYKPETRASLIFGEHGFLRGKLAPVASSIANALYGTDYTGSPFSITHEMKEQLIPMTIGNYIDLAREDPSVAATVASASAIFGVGLQTPFPAPSRTGLTAWGDPVGAFEDPIKNDLDKAYEEVGGSLGFPSETINGVQLTDEQYHSYVAKSGNYSKQWILPLIQNPNWGKIPATNRLSMLNEKKRMARDIAASAVMLESKGSSNDILKKSYAKKFGLDQPTVEHLGKQEALLNQQVSSESALKEQWAKLQVSDYDYGRMIDTNPLAYLGYTETKKDGVASIFKTPVTDLGMTFTGPVNNKSEYYPLISKILNEAGITVDKAVGKIILGPEFGEGKNTYTLEHELMHRGIMKLIETNPEYKRWAQESILQAFQAKYGSDKHSSELQEKFKALFPRNTKIWLDLKVGLADELQAKAKEIIEKKLGRK